MVVAVDAVAHQACRGCATIPPTHRHHMHTFFLSLKDSVLSLSCSETKQNKTKKAWTVWELTVRMWRHNGAVIIITDIIVCHLLASISHANRSRLCCFLTEMTKLFQNSNC